MTIWKWMLCGDNFLYTWWCSDNQGPIFDYLSGMCLAYGVYSLSQLSEKGYRFLLKLENSLRWGEVIPTQHSFSYCHSAQYNWNITDVPQWCLAVNNRWINHFVIARWRTIFLTKLTETKRYNTKWNKTYLNETISWGKTRQKLNEFFLESII
jgi:hypothetical protein